MQTPAEELEYKIYLATSPNIKQVDPNKMAEAQALVKNIKNSPQGLTLCLSNYANFAATDAKKFTIDILTYWLERRFTEIPSNVASIIFDFLSGAVIDTIAMIGPEGAEKLAEAQATFTMKTYLQIFPGIIERFYVLGSDKSKQSMLLRYILHLFKQLTTPSPMTLELHRTFIQKMQQDGSLAALTQIVQLGIQQRHMTAVAVLIYYAHFLDISFLDGGFLNELASDLYDDEFRSKNIPLVYLSLLQRQDTLDSKKAFIQLINLNGLLAQFCETPEFPEIVITRMGSVLSYLGFVFDSDQNYFNLSAKIGPITVLNYMNSFVLKHPEFHQGALNFGILRLRAYFQQNFDFEVEYIQCILEICLNCFVVNQQGSEQALISFLNGTPNILSDFSASLTLLLIIMTILQSKAKINQMQIFVPFLSQLFKNSATSPLFDNQHSALCAAFFSIISVFDERYPEPIIFQPAQIFRVLLPYTLNQSFYLRKFQKILVKCCLKYGIQNNINENDFGLFLQPAIPWCGKIYGSLINCAPIENRSAIVQQTIAKLLEILKSNTNQNVIAFSFAVLSTMKCPFEVPCLQGVLGFIQQMMANPNVQNNDYLLSKGIKGLSSLTLAGTQAFLQIFPNTTTILSLTSLANLASSIRRIANIEKSGVAAEIPNNDPGLTMALDNSWVTKFSSFLIAKLQDFSAQAPLFETEELGNYFGFSKSVVLFISNELSFVAPQEILALTNIIIDGVNRFYDSPEMNESLLHLGLALTTINNPEVVNILVRVIQVSLNFIYTQDILLVSPKWVHVLTILVRFYQRLLAVMQEPFQQNLLATAQSIGGKPQSVQAFLAVLANPDPNFFYALVNYSINFCFELLNCRIFV